MKMRRTIAPVGYRVPLRTLAGAAARRAISGGRSTRDLERCLEQHFGVERAFAVSSGKAALTVILQALAALSGRRKVIIPAYTCYSVPSAVVKAGLEVVPCDIGADSFDYDFDRLALMLDADVLCVLSVHLFGIPSDTARVKDLCRNTGIFVVEDAAQAMGGVHNGRPLGTCGDVGFFSLGRGKNVTCGSGGVVITADRTIADAVQHVVAALPRTGAFNDVVTLATLLASSVLVSPTLYWFPAGLPFLRLGETIFYNDFPVRTLSDLQSLLLREWPARLAQLETIRREHSQYYLANIAAVRDFGRDIPYLRFPLLLPTNGDRRRLLDREAGVRFGMSGMYPTSVGEIPELHGRLRQKRFPQADWVARTLVTLPTHPLLTPTDRARICNLVNAVVARAHGSQSPSVNDSAYLPANL